MTEQEKALALRIIEKVKAILADMPDPRVSKIEIERPNFGLNRSYVSIDLGGNQLIALHLFEKGEVQL